MSLVIWIRIPSRVAVRGSGQELATRLQHTTDFPNERLVIGYMLDDFDRHDAIERGIRER